VARSFFSQPLLDADKRALTSSAETEERVEEENVEVNFDGRRLIFESTQTGPDSDSLAGHAGAVGRDLALEWISGITTKVLAPATIARYTN